MELKENDVICGHRVIRELGRGGVRHGSARGLRRLVLRRQRKRNDPCAEGGGHGGGTDRTCRAGRTGSEAD